MRLLELRRLADNGHSRALKAFVDVELDNGTIIRDFRIIEEPQKRPWVAAPQVSWKDPQSGEIRYRTVVCLPDSLKGELDLLVLSAWSREKERNENAAHP